MNDKPKLLIFSVTSWNSKLGANTWASILQDYPADKVAVLCIREDPTDSKACSRSFVISENKVIKSIWRRSLNTGYEQFVSNLNNDNSTSDLLEHQERYKRMKRHRSYAMLLAREFVWILGKWKSPELDEFLDDFHPDIILHSMEGYIHLNRIVEYAVARTNAKAIGYIWDDNFTYKQHNKFGYYIYRYFQRRSLKSLAKKTSSFFAITERTKKEADKFFGINCTVLTKPLSSLPVIEEKKVKFPIQILYTGNLFIGRDRSLSLLRQCIEKINQSGNFFQLDVYTNSPLSDEYLAQNCTETCKIHPPIPQSQVLELQKQTDMLLFLEDIDGPDAKVARLSFSTKLTDYLSAGKCILAIGNKDTAPMEYLEHNNAALVADSKATIMELLTKIISNPNLCVQIASNAANLGISNHHPDKVSETFMNVIQEVFEK